MMEIQDNQIGEWLKKLERESWQLELLVSAFTIYLLMMATSSFDDFLLGVQFKYNLSSGALPLVFVFLILIRQSLLALTLCLIGHLILRGFWIGTIGLRSVQSNLDFSKLNYNKFFTEVLKRKVVSLGKLIPKLDEICSVIFAFAFLVISMLIAFGMYLFLIGTVAILLNSIIDVSTGMVQSIFSVVSAVIFLILLSTGTMYMIDYFTLGFFKKVKWLRRVYYPFYRLYSFITFAALSRSIYYYMISKFTKRKIRLVYFIIGTVLLVFLFLRFDQYQYFAEGTSQVSMSANYYDDIRSENDYIEKVSISSRYIDTPHFQVFFRYDPRDNAIIQSQCPNFKALKDDGLNWRLSFKTSGANIKVGGQNFSDEYITRLLECQSSIYQLSVNDSVYQQIKYYFFIHPTKKQKGVLATIPTDSFLSGENVLEIKKIIIDSVANKYVEFARLPFWYKE